MSQTGLLEERQVVNVADIQHVPLVEAGTRTVRREVVGVNEVAIVTIRRVIDRVTVGVGHTEA